jgi:hypothetical protein
MKGIAAVLAVGVVLASVSMTGCATRYATSLACEASEGECRQGLFGEGYHARTYYAAGGYYPPTYAVSAGRVPPDPDGSATRLQLLVTRAVRADRDRLSVMDLDTSREGPGGAFFLTLVVYRSMGDGSLGWEHPSGQPAAAGASKILVSSRGARRARRSPG